MTSQPLKPGATIGILGGGQLGRMLALAAARLGLKTHIYCPQPDSPAFEVSRRFTCAPYEDEAALDLFAADADVVTYEFENVPSQAAAFLRARRPVMPGEQVLEITQDRLKEKTFLSGLDIPVAAFTDITSLEGLTRAAGEIGLPAMLKTRRFGYDGKGQYRLESKDDIAAAWKAVGKAPAVLEAFVPFAREISVIAARGADGSFAAYDPPENGHREQILRRSTVPASIGKDVTDEAVEIARKIGEALGYIGVLAVELFVVEEKENTKLLVNEIAPRVHNSGHWTIDACTVGQFEQHIRAIAGWPLGSCARHSDAVMDNLIGKEAEDWAGILAERGVALHLYGKEQVRPGRKMGHVTRLKPRTGE